jgi:hypothetical protein
MVPVRSDRARGETISPPAPDEEAITIHPLAPAIEFATIAADRLKNVSDYQCLFVRREHLGGRLQQAESVELKVRLQPLAISARCLGPEQPRGREVVYLSGGDRTKASVYGAGVRGRLVRAEAVSIDDPRLLGKSRHRLLEYGVHRLADDLITQYRHDADYGECRVRLVRDVRVDGRACVCVEVHHPAVRRNFLFNVTRAYFDEQLQLPIRWEAYTWPSKPGTQSVLLEEYTYEKLTINNGLTDADFDPRRTAAKAPAGQR